MDFKELGWEGVYWILYSVELLGWCHLRFLRAPLCTVHVFPYCTPQACLMEDVTMC